MVFKIFHLKDVPIIEILGKSSQKGSTLGIHQYFEKYATPKSANQPECSTG